MDLEQNVEYQKILVQKYKNEVNPLLEYIPWFQSKAGKSVSQRYVDPRFNEHSLSFPVYDSMLLRFVKATEKTKLMTRNYVYVYSRNRLETPEDERALIEHTDLRSVENLNGILSRYIIGGRTKSNLWNIAVEEEIFLAILLKWKEILAIWDGPLA